MLHEGVNRVPTEALGELLGADGLVGKLQLVENALEGERHRPCAVIRLRGHLVHRLAQLVREVQSLQQGVHVACGSLVLQTW